MSTLQLASDTTGRLVVEWNKYPPHFRVITDGGRERAYDNEEAAMRAAKRLARKFNLTLKLDAAPIRFKQMAREFPDYDQDSLPAVPADWTDSSWHNDTCPSFTVEDVGLQIFIAEERAADRELQGGARYNVLDCKPIETTDLLSTDDWERVLDMVAVLRFKQEHQV